jgi:hypothetical protein
MADSINTVRVEVLRAFFLRGHSCAAGTVVDVSEALARELVYANKARLVPGEQADALSVEVEAPAPARKKKGSRE